MGDGEARVGEGEAIDEQEVEVDGAAFVLGVLGGASEMSFDGLGGVEELEGRAVPVAGEGGVVEVGGVGDAVNGCGDEGGGASEVLESGLFEELAGQGEGVFGVAEVGAEGDGDVVGAGEAGGREVVEGVEDEGGVCVGEGESLFGGAREGDAGHAGALGGADAREGVLEDDAVLRRDAEDAGGEEIALRVGLAALVVLAGDDGGESVGEAIVVGDLLDAGADGAGDDADGCAAVGELLEAADGGVDGDVAGLADALVEVGGDGLHVGDGGEGVRPAGLDFVENVVPGASAFELEDLLEGELDAAQGEGVLDGFCPDGFGVDEGAVEVKEIGVGHDAWVGRETGE